MRAVASSAWTRRYENGRSQICVVPCPPGLCQSGLKNTTHPRLQGGKLKQNSQKQKDTMLHGPTALEAPVSGWTNTGGIAPSSAVRRACWGEPAPARARWRASLSVARTEIVPNRTMGRPMGRRTAQDLGVPNDVPPSRVPFSDGGGRRDPPLQTPAAAAPSAPADGPCGRSLRSCAGPPLAPPRASSVGCPPAILLRNSR